MTLIAKRIVPIKATPTCVGIALTSSFSLGRPAVEVDQESALWALGSEHFEHFTCM